MQTSLFGSPSEAAAPRSRAVSSRTQEVIDIVHDVCYWVSAEVLRTEAGYIPQVWVEWDGLRQKWDPNFEPASKERRQVYGAQKPYASRYEAVKLARRKRNDWVRNGSFKMGA